MTIKQTEKAFGHKLIGSYYMKSMVAKALNCLPSDVCLLITQTTWIVGSFEDGWAFTLRGDEIKKNEHLIFLTDELMDAESDQIIWTIIHEIGHVYLGHRNSIGKVQTRTQIKRQEHDADLFTKKYFRPIEDL